MSFICTKLFMHHKAGLQSSNGFSLIIDDMSFSNGLRNKRNRTRSSGSLSLSQITNKPCKHVLWSLCSFSRWKLEAHLLWQRKLLFLFCITAQFMHAIGTNIAYYRHIQGEQLKDAGFDLVPPLPHSHRVLSEFIFFSIFFIGIAHSLLPFLYQRPPVYTSTLIIRTLFVISLCVLCRCITFLSTSLPGPAPHCQPHSHEYNPPETMYEVASRIDVFKGCGDLIFSSHSALSLSIVLTVFVYGKLLVPHAYFKCMFYCVIVPLELLLFILIIAARKHYTVDVVVAAYTTPLLYYASYYFVKDQVNVVDELAIEVRTNEQNGEDYSVFPMI
eukprot:657928_1